MQSTIDRIPELEEYNYHKWLVRAYFRREKLWKYTQEPEEEASNKAQKEWEVGVIGRSF